MGKYVASSEGEFRFLPETNYIPPEIAFSGEMKTAPRAGFTGNMRKITSQDKACTKKKTVQMRLRNEDIYTV